MNKNTKPTALDTVGSALKVAGPALQGLSELVHALKEPLGRRKMEQMRAEFAESFEGLQMVIVRLDEALQATEQARSHQAEQIRALEVQLAYMQLPFWQRWFMRPPSPEIRGGP